MITHPNKTDMQFPHDFLHKSFPLFPLPASCFAPDTQARTPPASHPPFFPHCISGDTGGAAHASFNSRGISRGLKAREGFLAAHFGGDEEDGTFSSSSSSSDQSSSSDHHSPSSSSLHSCSVSIDERSDGQDSVRASNT